MLPLLGGAGGAELHLSASPWVVCVLWVLFSAMNSFSCFPKEKRLDFLEFLQLFFMNDKLYLEPTVPYSLLIYLELVFGGFYQIS
jgi:hypothetical protein